MTPFLAIGIAGLLLVVLSLVVGDFLDGLIDGALDALEADWISTAVIGGFISAFGFGSATAAASGSPWPASVAVGLVVGTLVGWLAWWLTDLLKDGPSDGTVTIGDSVGQVAKVITAIPMGGYGVVRLSVGGHTMTYNATAGMPIEPGIEVQVVGVVSPTALRVNAVWHPSE